MPHALYDLAKLEDTFCVISPNFLVDGDELRLGNELIEGFCKDQKFKNSAHTLDAIFKALQDNKVRIPERFEVQLLEASKQKPPIREASDLFIGYLCFDAWIGNTDRHAENWGIITKSRMTNQIINVLAPTFDHASSLGRNESDKKRIERLQTKDEGFNVTAYIKRAPIPIYDNQGQALNTISLIQACKRYSSQATVFWVNKIAKIMSNNEKIKEIFDRIPDEFISIPAKDFAMAILNKNAERLRELQND